jgi:hypothetical protein
MNEVQDKRAVYMGTFEAYKKSNAKHMTELVDVTQEIWKFSSKHTVILYILTAISLTLSILALVI